jgi:ubiquitin thioesterase OTU1
MRIRIRGPSGQSTVQLKDTDTVADLISKIYDATSLPSFDVKIGTPPLPLESLDLSSLDPTAPLKDTNLKLANQLLTVSARDGDTVQTDSQSTQAIEGSTTSSQTSRTQATITQPLSASQTETESRFSLQRKPNITDNDPPEVPIPSHAATLVLRVMPDDNSCLFRALGTCIFGSSIDGVVELRDTVATVIQSQPERFNAAVLNRDPDLYCKHIKSPDSWGGYIDVTILSEAFDICVRTINVKDGHVYSYNESAPKQCIIVYSGIHYDAIALSPSDPPYRHATSPMEFDQKQFPISDNEVLDKAKELCANLRERHYFTDTAGFSLKCGVCGWRGQGKRVAEKHAKETGHQSFEEGDW